MRFAMRVHDALPAPRRQRHALLAVALLGLSLGACEDPAPPPTIRTLDGPTDVAFACYGRMRTTGGQEVTGLLPMELCQAWDQVTLRRVLNEATADEDDDYVRLDQLPPDGQGPTDLTPAATPENAVTTAQIVEVAEWQDAVRMYGFVLQRNQGTVAVASGRLGNTHQFVSTCDEDGDQPTLAPREARLSCSTNCAGINTCDGDPFAPGTNVIPVGSQPVGIVSDSAGCHMLTANAGSCDLSLLDVRQVLSGDEIPEVRSVRVRSASGELLSARPRAVVGHPGSPPEVPPGTELVCSDSFDGLVYVAYPDCNAVAAIHAGTGEIRASIVFAEDGSVVLGDGNLSCGAATCGAPSTPPVVEGPDAGAPDASVPDAGVPDAGALDAGPSIAAVGTRPRPVALHMASDGGRLYIGAENSPRIAIIELGPDALPARDPVTSLPRPALSVKLDCEREAGGKCRDDDRDGTDDDVGVTALAATGLIPMGGELGRLDEGPFGDFRFVYAAATDNTVRVVEVGGVLRECDTQIDARFLHDVRDGQLLACLPLGDPALPRRAGARSPGIHMPGDGRPLDIVFVQAPGIETFTDKPRPPISPINLIGHFAYISLSTGNVVVVNVDDDNYGDVELGSVPVEVDLSLALPHQLRDTGSARRSSRFCEEDKPDELPPAPTYYPLLCDFSGLESCAFPGGTPQGPPAMTAPSVTTLSPGYVAEAYLGALPELRALECVTEADTTTTPPTPAKSSAVPELSSMVPDPLRELVFPDLQGVRGETWNIVWEGLLSRQNAGALDPGVRLGYVELDNGFALRDGGAPFCEMGAEPGDVVTLRGCDPTLNNAHCQASEVCAVLPDVDVQSQTGICVPAGSEDLVQNTCLPFFGSRRRFLVEQTYAGRLVLAERKRALRTTPVAGCSSAAQCELLYELELDLAANPQRKLEAPTLPTDKPCDPNGPAGVCDTEDENDDGQVCLGTGFCGDPLPPARSWSCEPEPIVDPARSVCLMTCASDSECETGWQCSGDGYCVEATLPPAECVKTLQRYDVRAGNVFAVIGSITGFLHDRIADPLTGQCVADPTANPLAQGRVPLIVPPCTGEGFLDVAPNPCATTVSHFEDEGGERQAPAIRFRNPAFVTHLVDPILDPATSGIECTLDSAACPPMAFVPPGYAITFTIAGGFSPLNAVSELRYPVGMAGDPLGSIWIMDQGDATATVRGQVARLAPLTLQVTATLQ